jgi:hypothetical protein
MVKAVFIQGPSEKWKGQGESNLLLVVQTRPTVLKTAGCPAPLPLKLRDEEETNLPILLVFESVFGVASMGTDNKYAPIEAP